LVKCEKSTLITEQNRPAMNHLGVQANMRRKQPEKCPTMSVGNIQHRSNREFVHFED
jgi:hypothetical protein